MTASPRRLHLFGIRLNVICGNTQIPRDKHACRDHTAFDRENIINTVGSWRFISTRVFAPVLLHRDNSCDLIHFIYRRDAQLKGIRFDSIKLSRRRRKRSGFTPGRERRKEKKEEGRKKRRREEFTGDARAYMRVGRDNNLPPLITSTILSPEESALITPPARRWQERAAAPFYKSRIYIYDS